MTTLVLVAGVAGSGKSTIAQPLACVLKAVVVDIDPYKRQVVNPDALTQSIDPPHVRWEYYRLALKQVFQHFEQGARFVVLDEMFHVRDLRRRIAQACRDRRIQVRWIEVQCSDEEAARRIEERPRNGHILSSEELLKIRAEVARVFDPFADEGPHLMLCNVGSVETSVTQAYRWLQND